MRIGTNHGSLSDRILGRYGDTPLGMVESALEFLRICQEEDYDNIILSMKASNTQVMVQAYRLLIVKMKEENMNYPLHLGVTEAGEGEDGRIKSAVGIGTLLEDGIGDTVRVSLTEEPEFEIPVARELVRRYDTRKKHQNISSISDYPIDSYNYIRRESNKVLNIGEKQVPIVMADFSLKKKLSPASFFALGYRYSVPTDKWNIGDMACDYVFLGDEEIDFNIPGTLGVVYHYDTWLKHQNEDRVYPFLTHKQYLENPTLSKHLNIVYACLPDLSTELIDRLKSDPTAVLLIDSWNAHGMAEQRRLFVELINQKCTVPVIIGRAYETSKRKNCNCMLQPIWGLYY
jgi:(E)-4-hydroxy-3-methylbut-2-enyl-diphosphate synthase